MLPEQFAIEGPPVLMVAAGRIIEINFALLGFGRVGEQIPVRIVRGVTEITKSTAGTQCRVVGDVGSEDAADVAVRSVLQKRRQDAVGRAAIRIGRDFRNWYERPIRGIGEVEAVETVKDIGELRSVYRARSERRGGEQQTTREEHASVVQEPAFDACHDLLSASGRGPAEYPPDRC